jgi:hypothetical protein
MRVRQVAQALGWVSLALGAMEVLAPKTVGRSVGLDKPNTVRAFGLREIASGAMILARPRTSAGVWTRVGGDVLDLGALAMARPTGRQRWLHRAMLGAVATALAADAWTGMKLRREEQQLQRRLAGAA